MILKLKSKTLKKIEKMKEEMLMTHGNKKDKDFNILQRDILTKK